MLTIIYSIIVLARHLQGHLSSQRVNLYSTRTLLRQRLQIKTQKQLAYLAISNTRSHTSAV